MSFRAHLTSNPTTPLINLVETRESLVRFAEEMGRLRERRGDRTAIGHHEDRLGKARGTFTSEYRWSVWEGPNWRVFVSRKGGVGFEVKETLSEAEGWAAFDDYAKKVG